MSDEKEQYRLSDKQGAKNLCKKGLPPVALYLHEQQLFSAWQVFFIKDGIMFPDLVHSLRPNPKTHIQEGWRILDFLGNYPESTLMVHPPAF